MVGTGRKSGRKGDLFFVFSSQLVFASLIGFLLNLDHLGSLVGAQYIFRETISSSIPGSRKYLGDVIQRPRAKFYTEKNLQGDYEPFNTRIISHVYPRCRDLTYLSGIVQSVDTMGSCIRVYSKRDCSGESRALYPYISINSVKHPLFEGGARQKQKYYYQRHLTTNVASVGPCFHNELDESTIYINVATNETEFQKTMLRHNPDLPFVPDRFKMENRGTVQSIKMNEMEFGQIHGQGHVHGIRKYEFGTTKLPASGKGQYISALITFRDVVRGREEELPEDDDDSDSDSVVKLARQDEFSGDQDDDDSDENEQDDDEEGSDEEQADDNTDTTKVTEQNGYVKGHFISSKLGMISEREKSLPFANTFYMTPSVKEFMEVTEDRIATYLKRNPHDRVRIRINAHYAPPGSENEIPGRLLYLLYRVEAADKKSNFHSQVLLPNIERAGDEKGRSGLRPIIIIKNKKRTSSSSPDDDERVTYYRSSILADIPSPIPMF